MIQEVRVGELNENLRFRCVFMNSFRRDHREGIPIPGILRVLIREDEHPAAVVQLSHLHNRPPEDIPLDVLNEFLVFRVVKDAEYFL